DRVGYRVRDEDVSGPDTQLLYVTPGVALRMLARDPALSDFAVVWLDELHERTLDLDLLLAVLQQHRIPRGLALGVMSATVAGDVIADAMGGVHLHGEGRTFPVDITYAGQGDTLPRAEGLSGRVAKAVRETADAPGDVLVFLPGKAEIRACAEAIGAQDVDIIELHGSLTLAQQARVFGRSRRRRVVLSTNVAETSLTIDGIGVVIDSGLVRQQRWHGGHSYLMTTQIADDSADQRAGRAGRTAAGLCVRLWSPHVRLRPFTLPEVRRLSLVPLVLAAAAAGSVVEDLPLLEMPAAESLDVARAHLTALGALTVDGLTDRGQRLFRLPVDAWHGRLLVEGERIGLAAVAVDLVAALSTRRPLFVGAPPDDPDDDLRLGGCDATSLLRAVRHGDARRHGLDRFALQAAREQAKRLRRVLGLPKQRFPARDLDIPASKQLALLALGADKRAAYARRRRGRKVAWGNGADEVMLGRSSSVDEEKSEWLVALSLRGVGQRHDQATLRCDAAIGVRASWLVEAGCGRERAGQDRLRTVDGQRVLTCEVERVHAGKVLSVDEVVPTGDVAREAGVTALINGRLNKALLPEVEQRLKGAALYRRLLDIGHEPEDPAWSIDSFWADFHGPFDARQWFDRLLTDMGFDSGDQWELLDPDDLTPPELPERVLQRLNHAWPQTLVGAGARYRIEYDLDKSVATLVREDKGRRAEPPRQLLPRLPGFAIDFVERGRRVRLRGR
ncbi:MAG: hypothetical protein KC502_11745, partial [Myxococcales bacterium]|nr:hypothetical protein [Myxococcales bacterium]